MFCSGKGDLGKVKFHPRPGSGFQTERLRRTVICFSLDHGLNLSLGAGELGLSKPVPEPVCVESGLPFFPESCRFPGRVPYQLPA